MGKERGELKPRLKLTTGPYVGALAQMAMALTI